MSENNDSKGPSEQPAAPNRPRPQSFAEAKLDLKLLWKDRKRILGMPISFTRYIVDEDHLTLKIGLLNTRVDDVLLYRILDIKMTQSIWQKLFGVGTLTVFTADKSQDQILLRNIKDPEKVRRYLGQLVEQERESRRLVGRELFGVAGEDGDIDGILS